MHVSDVVLEAHDYDDDGTYWIVRGRGLPIGTYSIWDVRRIIRERLNANELELLEANAPALEAEQIVTRVTLDRDGWHGTNRLERERAMVAVVKGVPLAIDEGLLAGVDEDLDAVLGSEDPAETSLDEALRQQLPTEGDRARITAAIFAFAEQHGRAPTNKEAGTMGVPALHLVKREFGSWANAVEAAGLGRPKRGGARKRKVAVAQEHPDQDLAAALLVALDEVHLHGQELKAAEDDLEAVLERVRERAYR